ncbi:MAG: hypothetical protein PGN13_04655 [Patulibacter minatonensis]
MARSARRRTLPISAVVLTLVGVALGAIWSLSAQRGGAGTSQGLEGFRSPAARGAASAAAADPEAPPPLCRSLRKAKVGEVRDASLEELSGLVVSRRDRGVLWAIEDSGNPAVLAALRPGGGTVGLWTVAGAENFDWEDVATGPGGPGGVPWLYAADLGDNLRQRDHITIYRVPEPRAPAGGGTTAPAGVLRLEYPDGSHDAESFVVDPVRGTLLVVTKGVPGAVYAAGRPERWSGTVRMRRVGNAGIAYATAADVSADGSTVAVRGYFNVAIWQRRGREPLTATLRRQGCLSPTPLDDGQGEAIALTRSGRSAYLVAEGVHPPVERITPEP